MMNDDKITVTRNDLRISTRVITSLTPNRIGGGQHGVISTVLWVRHFELSTCSAWGTWVYL